MTQLTLGQARQLTRRAIAKAEDVGAATAVAVLDEAGVLLTASRMDAAGPYGMAAARGKAYLAAATRQPSAAWVNLALAFPPLIVESFLRNLREPVFSGMGGRPIREGAAQLGAVAVSGAGIGPFVRYPGLSSPGKLIAAGKPANAEDLVVSYALGGAYLPQHGDDAKRWVEAYGALPTEPGSGLDPVPPAQHQRWLDRAIAVADRALALAQHRGLDVAIAVTDRHGELIQCDRMEAAPAAAVDWAAAMASTAANLRSSSREAMQRFPGTDDWAHLARTTTFKLLPLPGGVLWTDGKDGPLLGAVGIAGADPGTCESLASDAVSTDSL